MKLLIAPKSGAAHAAPARPLRVPNEFYPTPPEATRALLSVERFDGDIWEPACGNGQIAKVLADNGYAVVSTDLHAYGAGEPGVDFLAQKSCRAKHIVTNPPYGFGLADLFVEQALALTRETGGSVAMLLNLASLCHPSRTAWWQRNAPTSIYAIDDVVCWHGPVPRGFTKQRYCWVVWKPRSSGQPSFGWLSARDFR